MSSMWTPVLNGLLEELLKLLHDLIMGADIMEYNPEIETSQEKKSIETMRKCIDVFKG